METTNSGRPFGMNTPFEPMRQSLDLSELAGNTGKIGKNSVNTEEIELIFRNKKYFSEISALFAVKMNFCEAGNSVALVK